MKQKVAVAMSGGVDSAVAALLLRDQGYDVVGFTLRLFAGDAEPAGFVSASCCSLSSENDARRTAGRIGIPHYVLDFKSKFNAYVINPFCDTYAKGMTPNPCVECNRWIKFRFLLDAVNSMGMEFLSTGHYAIRSQDSESGLFSLSKGVDPLKDQSYFLYMLTQEHLKSIIFPNGNYNKTEIRKIATEAGLPVADKGESQEICFAGDDSYTRYIAEKNPDAVREGKIIDSSGKILGRHRGIINYTVGQRKGLGVSAQYPLHVIELDPAANTVIVGAREELFSNGLIAGDAVYISKPPENGEKLEVKIRYNAPSVPALFQKEGEGAFRLDFETPQFAVAPGQAAVMYKGATVIGGGTIMKSIRNNEDL